MYILVHNGVFDHIICQQVASWDIIILGETEKERELYVANNRTFKVPHSCVKLTQNKKVELFKYFIYFTKF